MTDKITKFLSRLPKDQLAYLQPYLAKINANELDGMDVKPVKGHKNIYRVRIGKYRIIFELKDTVTRLLHAGKRDDKTYRDF